MTRVMVNAVDRQLLELLRKEGASNIGQLTNHFGVTATAIRQRLQRLMGDELVERFAEKHGRGRPSHRYRLTNKGQRLAGDNYGDLAEALWDEIRNIEDPEIRRGLIKRVAGRLAEGLIGRDHNEGETDEASADVVTATERMQQLKSLMEEREVPFEVDESGPLPVLTAHACPYPGIAEHDPTVCEMEKMMIAELLGGPVEMSEFRLEGGACCSFQPAAADPTQTTTPDPPGEQRPVEHQPVEHQPVEQQSD